MAVEPMFRSQRASPSVYSRIRWKVITSRFWLTV